MKEQRAESKARRAQSIQTTECGRKDKVRLVKILYCILIVLYAVFPSPLKADTTVNKKFVYHIFWSGIRAGTSELTITSTPEGTEISTHAESAPFVSVFYKVDDVARSTLYPDGYPKVFALKISEGRHRRDKETHFGPRMPNERQKVIYYDKIDNDQQEFFMDRPVYDPLSAFFALTKMSLEADRSLFLDIFDSKKVWHTEIQVLKKEKVRVPAGEFNTIQIKPLLKSEGIFKKTGDIFIWVTDDDRKLPVLMKSKAVIGTFTVELAEGDF